MEFGNLNDTPGTTPTPQPKKPLGGSPVVGTGSPMVTAIHGPADAIHPMVSALHGGGVNSFGQGATPPQDAGGTSIGANFHGALSDAAQGGRINSMMANQAGDAAAIRTEKAQNAPLEREHMAHMWADEDTQRHQQLTAGQLENDRKGWEFKREQQFEGQHPQLVHIMGLKQHMLENPEGPMGVGVDGKPNGMRDLSPSQKAFMGELDRMAQGLQSSGMGGTPTETSKAAITPQDNTKPSSLASAGNTLRAGAEAGGIAAAGMQAAKRLGPKLAAMIPNRFGGQILRKVAGPAMGVAGTVAGGGLVNELDPGSLENFQQHPWASLFGGLLGGGIGVGSKPETVGKPTLVDAEKGIMQQELAHGPGNVVSGEMHGPVPNAEQSFGPINNPTIPYGPQRPFHNISAVPPINKASSIPRLPILPNKVPGYNQILPRGTNVRLSSSPKGQGGLGANISSSMEERGKPLQGTVPQSANGPATTNPTLRNRPAFTPPETGWPSGTEQWAQTSPGKAAATTASPQAAQALPGAKPKGAGASFSQALPPNTTPQQITPEMQRTLKMMGLSDVEIAALTPQQAWNRVLKGQ